MPEENKKILGIILVVFIGVIVSLAFLNIIADEIYTELNPMEIVNESLDISSLRIGLTNDINTSLNVTVIQSTYIPSTVVISNVTNGSELTDHYIANSSGIYFVNDSFMVDNFVDNDTYASYSYYGSNYVTDTSTRTIIGLLVLFAALGLMIYSFGKFWAAIKDSVTT